MAFVSNTFNKTFAQWAGKTQPNLLEANIVALGSTTDSYAISFKNGGRSYNVSGPPGLAIGNAVSIGVYPGSSKKYMILQKSRGGKVPSAASYQV